jgi:hypothetical protein
MNILKNTNLFFGPIACYGSDVVRAVLEDETAISGGTLAYVTDDATGVQILQSWGSLERIRGKNNSKLSIQIVHPALDVEKQIDRIKSIADKRPLTIIRDYSRDLQPLRADDPWIFWQGILSRALGCKVVSICHSGHLPIPERLDWKQFQSVFKIKDGFVQGSPLRARVNEPWDLVQVKGGNEVIHLLGKFHPGITVFDEIKELVTS